jgi:hypothetical protein
MAAPGPEPRWRASTSIGITSGKGVWPRPSHGAGGLREDGDKGGEIGRKHGDTHEERLDRLDLVGLAAVRLAIALLRNRDQLRSENADLWIGGGA